jgi:hypothetical protein
MFVLFVLFFVCVLVQKPTMASAVQFLTAKVIITVCPRNVDAPAAAALEPFLRFGGSHESNK